MIAGVKKKTVLEYILAFKSSPNLPLFLMESIAEANSPEQRRSGR